MTAPAGWVDDGTLLPNRERWVFVGRTADGQAYLWRRADVPADAVNIVTGYCQTVASFWPAPKPAATIRPGSILDRIAEYLGWRTQPGTQQDYTLAKGGPQ